MFVIQIKPV